VSDAMKPCRLAPGSVVRLRYAEATADGTPAEVEREVSQCIAKAATGGGFILSSSNTIHSGVRPENYFAMLSTLKERGGSPGAGRQVAPPGLGTR
jgi:hypothetical protein